MADSGKEFAQFNYEQHATRLLEFVQSLREHHRLSEDAATVSIALDWLIEFDAELAQLFMQNIPTYIKLLQEAIAIPGSLPERVRRQ